MFIAYNNLMRDQISIPITFVFAPTFQLNYFIRVNFPANISTIHILILSTNYMLILANRSHLSSLQYLVHMKYVWTKEGKRAGAI